jgi:hypothetical protein
MNVKDRQRMDNFENKLNVLDGKLNNLEDKVGDIYNKLVDDERTTSVGVISTVNKLNKEVNKLNVAYNIAKWVIGTAIIVGLGILGNQKF